MKTIYLFTDQFPYGRGEKPFLLPEIEALAKQYNIVIVPKLNLGRINESSLPTGVRVVPYPRPSKVRLLLHSLSLLYSPLGRQELVDLIKDGFTLPRLADSVKVFVNASDFRSFLESIGAFGDVGETLYFSFWFNSPCLAVAMEKQKHEGVRLLSRIHGYDLFNIANRNGRQPFKRVMRDCVDRLVFVSENARAYFEETFGKEAFSGQYRLNRLGVASHQMQAAAYDMGRQRRKRLLVSCANMVPGKRVHLVAEGLAASARKGEIRWVHFGDGPEFESVKKLVSSYGLDAELRGYTPNDEIIAFYGANYVDAEILTTAHEGGCPVALQEALSFGIPIIGTDVGGVPETVYKNGVLLTKDPSPAEIARAIENVCFAEKAVVEEMRSRSFALWKQRFDATKNKADFLGIVGELMDGI